MAVAYDAATESVRTATTDPYSFDHTGRATGSGGVQGVVVITINYTTATDQVNAVTYGGVSLNEVVRASDTDTELTDTQLWFAGSGLTGGTQSVEVDFTSATDDDFHIVTVTLTGSADLEVVDSDEVNEDTADPSVTLSYNGRICITIGGIAGGLGTVGSYTLLSGMSAVHDNDSGTEIQRVDRQTTPGTSDFTFGYTSVTDDVSLVAAAISEVYEDSATLNAGTVDDALTAGNSGFDSITATTSYYYGTSLGRGRTCASAYSVVSQGKFGDFSGYMSACRARMYFMYDVLPTTNCIIIGMRSTADATTWGQLRLKTDGTMDVRDNVTATGDSGSFVTSPDTVYRVDYEVIASGNQTVKIFEGEELNNTFTETPTASFTGTLGARTWNSVLHGAVSSNAPGTLYYGYCAFNSATMPSPLTFNVGRQLVL